MNVIRFEEALKIIESGSPVRLRYVSFDRRRKSGGQIKEHEVMLSRERKDWLTPDQSRSASSTQNHYEHFTRNFYQCIDGKQTMSIKTIHLPLILQVNEKLVML